MSKPIHTWSLEEILRQFSVQEAIDEVVISCAENDVSLSDQPVEELLAQLYELC